MGRSVHGMVTHALHLFCVLLYLWNTLGSWLQAMHLLVEDLEESAPVSERPKPLFGSGGRGQAH